MYAHHIAAEPRASFCFQLRNPCYVENERATIAIAVHPLTREGVVAASRAVQCAPSVTEYGGDQNSATALLPRRRRRRMANPSEAPVTLAPSSSASPVPLPRRRRRRKHRCQKGFLN